MNIEFESEVKPPLVIKVGDKQYGPIKAYAMETVSAAEKAINGKSLKSVLAWLDMEWLDIAKVLHAGIAAVQPEVPYSEIKALCDELGAEGCIAIRYALTRLNFPKYIERLETRIAERARAGSSESPNVQSGAER